MDCHDRQEERVSTSSLVRSSILDSKLFIDSSSAAADVLRNDLNGLRRNDVNAGTSTRLTGSQNCNSASSSVSPLEIECFNEVDISAACLLLEMSSTSTSPRDDAAAKEECSQKQPCSIVRVSDYRDHDHAVAPPPPRLRELSELIGAKRSAGCWRASDDEIRGAVQERKATWEGEATYSSSSTPRSLRLELKTLGKKRIKPRKEERELVFRMNEEVLSSYNKFDILERSARKRNYKSLRELLRVNS